MKKILKYSMLSCLSAFAAPSYALEHINLEKNSFVALTFHDVRDDVKPKGDRDVYAISTKNLSGFLDWIKTSGWRPISLKQLQDAKAKGQDLPENAVILCFDDGALSSYSRVFPLLKHYQMPAVFAIPTSWINGNNKDAYTAYGEGNLMNWDQMREMQKSGLVEFASHSDDLHKGILANPQNNQKPAAIYRMYLPDLKRYESDQEFKTRIYQDLKKSKQVLDQELGINTQAIIWPYGAVNKEVAEIATEAGLPMSFSLGKSVANDKNSTLYQRVLIVDNPSAEDIHGQINDVFKGVDDPLMQNLRSIGLNLNQIASTTLQQSDEKLSEFLQQLDVLKSNTLWLDVAEDQNNDGKIDTVYFKTEQNLPQQVDLFSRTDWQSRTRVGQYVIANFPIEADQDTTELVGLAKDLTKFNSSVNAINLDTRQTLSCIWSNQTYKTNACQTQIEHIWALQTSIDTAIEPYLNISGNYFSVISVPLMSAPVAHMQQVLQDLSNKTDLLNLKLDIIYQPQQLKSLVEALKHLDQSSKDHIHVSLELTNPLDLKQAHLIRQATVQLQQQGIQKFGVSNYQLSQGKQVHEWLYPALSLNTSPVTYRK